jgi:predicted PurR-regulated permease PerM
MFNFFKNSAFKSILEYLVCGIVVLSCFIIIYLMFDNMIPFIIAFYLFFIISMFVFDNYKYSEWLIIRINQIFTIIVLLSLLVLVLYLMDYFDTIGNIWCEGGDSVESTLSNIDSSNSSNSSNNSSNTYNNSSNESTKDIYSKKDR